MNEALAVRSASVLQAKENSNVAFVEVVYQSWLDSRRNREIPVKIYMPKQSSAAAPVIVFSHGLGGSREAAVYLGEALAEHGYVSVHIQHPGSDESLWKTGDGKGLKEFLQSRKGGGDRSALLARLSSVGGLGSGGFGSGRFGGGAGSSSSASGGLGASNMLSSLGAGNRSDLVGAIRSKIGKGASGENLKLRAEDAIFVLDELARRNDNDAVLKGRLDLNRIGMAGHSFGALTTMAMAGQNFAIGKVSKSVADPRVKAAIYLSPPVNLHGREASDVYGKIKIPGMLMTGTEDNSPIGETKAEDRPLPFYAIRAGEQYLVNFEGGTHSMFGGRSKTVSAEAKQGHEKISRLCIAFFDAYLCGDTQAKNWLKQDAGKYLGSRAKYEFH
ncbi:MAG: hypothetical protein K2Y32_08970 [Candidatus Obscuribacterales bacterium]|nr:hypothetical protein [Candidatus Obscuribacterales bacterium]